MRRISVTFFALLLLSGGLYYWPQISAKFLELNTDYIAPLFSSNPCKRPISYHLGDFDAKFGISKEYFLKAVADAEAIWEKPFGRELFTYVPEDPKLQDLKINLIYDYRQEATSRLKSLGIVVENTRSSYESLKAKFTALKSDYENEKAAFETRLAAFNDRSEAYQKEVEYWNRRGGAPKAEYSRLEDERIALNTEAEALKYIQNNLNTKVDQINALAVALNRLVDSLNLSVDKYNTVSTSRGESFEEGVYVTNGISEEIDIYEFSSRAKLVRVLAHELGHALGLEHVEDSKAIMYKFNQGSNATLTKTDLDALKTKCGI